MNEIPIVLPLLHLCLALMNSLGTRCVLSGFRKRAEALVKIAHARHDDHANEFKVRMNISPLTRLLGVVQCRSMIPSTY